MVGLGIGGGVRNKPYPHDIFFRGKASSVSDVSAVGILVEPETYICLSESACDASTTPFDFTTNSVSSCMAVVALMASGITEAVSSVSGVNTPYDFTAKSTSNITTEYN